MAYVSTHTKEENRRIVNRILDTQIRVNGGYHLIREKGKASNLSYDIVKAIKEVMERHRLDARQQEMLFGRLGWKFKCSECRVAKTVSKYVPANSFDIKLDDGKVELKSVGCCESCDERRFEENDYNYSLSSERYSY